jgi:hypothetical protein
MRLHVGVLLFVLTTLLSAVAQTDTQVVSSPAHWSLGGFQSFEAGYFQGSAALVKHFGNLPQFPHFAGPIFSTKAGFAIKHRFGFGMGLSFANLRGRGPVADTNTNARLEAAGLQGPKMDGMIGIRFTQINPYLTFAVISRKKLRVGIEAGPSIGWLDHIYRGKVVATIATDGGPMAVSEEVFDKGRDFLPVTPRIGAALNLNIKGPLYFQTSGSFNTFGIQGLAGFSLKF